MDEVLIKTPGINKTYNQKVRTQHVRFGIKPRIDGRAPISDSIYFVTKFPAIDTTPVIIQTVDLKLKKYDTSLFDVKLIVFQVYKHDTTTRIFRVDGSSIKNNKTTITLKEQRVILMPGEFYMGYGIAVKNLKEETWYRIFSTDKGGEGALISFIGGWTIVNAAQGFPHIFPFSIAYRRTRLD